METINKILVATPGVLLQLAVLVGLVGFGTAIAGPIGGIVGFFIFGFIYG